MKIDVLEWPLRKNKVHCRVAVVELHCPEVITAWRNLTWMIVNNLKHKTQAMEIGRSQRALALAW